MILSLNEVHAHYGKSHVLQGVSLHVNSGELVTLLGRNGAGKTTTLKTIVGVLRPSQGTVRLYGHELQGLAPHAIARQGACLGQCDEPLEAVVRVDGNRVVLADPHHPSSIPLFEVVVQAQFDRLPLARAEKGST